MVVMTNAWDELQEDLEPNEIIEAIVFGNWGWNGYKEPNPPFISLDHREILLTSEEAKPLMQDWSFYSDYGSPLTYAVYIWTNKRIFWVTQYNGSTNLNSIPRNPQAILPEIFGS